MVTALAPTRRYTIDDLDQFPDDRKFRELVDGQVVEWDLPSQEHGMLETELSGELRQFVKQHRLGRVSTGDGMVRILGSVHHARGGDIEFFRVGNYPQDARAAATVTVPDFVIEIISPTDRADLVLDKVRDWLRAGVRLLWYINPETGVTTVYRGDRVSHVAGDEVLDGGDVLPGLKLRLRDILNELAVDGVDSAGV
jgi:Uma2 family endonuclease